MYRLLQWPSLLPRMYAPHHAHPLPCTPPCHACPLPWLPTAMHVHLPCALDPPPPWSKFLTHARENYYLSAITVAGSKKLTNIITCYRFSWNSHLACGVPGLWGRRLHLDQSWSSVCERNKTIQGCKSRIDNCLPCCPYYYFNLQKNDTFYISITFRLAEW